MPFVADFPHSGTTDTLRRVRQAVLPPGFPQRAYIQLNLPSDRISIKQRYDALLPGWRFVGEGAGRIVYLEPRLLFVVKFPKWATGARDNIVEAETYRRASGAMLGVMAQVTAAASDGLWLEMPYGSEGINGGAEFDAANRAVFAAGLRCLDLKVDSFRKFHGNQVRLVDYGEGGCLPGGIWGDDYTPAVTTVGQPSGEADLRNFVAALYDPQLRNALTKAAQTGTTADVNAALLELDRLVVRLRAAHASDTSGSPLNRMLVPKDGLRAFLDARDNPPYFDANRTRAGHARDALNQLEVLNHFAVTQARLPAPIV